ncbi:MAG: extracellular solute-binding protein [Rhizobiales bacterium]|nr:extracellular solute-binding protein [Hyphomicrobiales bacterium]
MHPGIMKGFLRFTSTTLFAGVVASMALSTANADSKVVYLLSWGGTIQTTFEKEGWADRFQKDTGYQVVLVPKATSSEIMATAIAQKDNPQVDVVMCDYSSWLLGKHQGLFADIDDKSVPNLKNVYDYASIHDGNNIIGSYVYADTIGIIYQPEMFKENNWKIPTGWDDFMRPELAGKIAIPPVSNTYGMFTLVHFARAGGGGEKNIDPGFEALKKLAPSVMDWTTTFAKLGEEMQSQQVALAVFDTTSGHEIARRGIPAKVVVPDPDYLSPTAVGVVAHSPNPEGARALLNWMIGKDYQQYRAERFGNNAMNKTIEISAEAAHRLLTKEEMARLKPLDFETIIKDRPAWNERFEREIAPIR